MKRTPKDPRQTEFILQASSLKDRAEVRFLVSDYYMSQEMRKRHDMQIRHLSEGGKESNLAALSFTADAFANAEAITKKALKAFVESSTVGRWLTSHIGIDAVIASGFLAHFDIEQAPTVGHFWRFAGLDPTCKWEKGEKRPFNAALKQLCYHAGECIKRTHNHVDSTYGPIYQTYKAFVVKKNDDGANVERAKTYRTTSADVRATLAKGKLPDGNLDRQACNRTVKILLSHLHAVMYWERYGAPPPKPFAIAILGHAHEVPIPNIEMFPGLAEAMRGRLAA